MPDGATLRELEPRVNLSFTEMEKALKMLAVESRSPVLQRGNRWYTTPVKHRPELLRDLIADIGTEVWELTPGTTVTW